MSEETCGQTKPHFPSEPAPVELRDAAVEPIVLADPVSPFPTPLPIAIAEMSDALEEEGDGSDIEIVESLDLPLRALEIMPPPLESGTRSLEGGSLDSLAASLVAIADDMLTTDDLDGFLSELDDDRIAPLESGMAPRMPTIMPLARCGLNDELEPALTPSLDEHADLMEKIETPAAVESTPAPNDDYETLLRVLATVAEPDAAVVASLTASLAEFLASDSIASAWRAILRGESDDFAACGAKSLDEWAAEALARFVDAPAKAATFRRELRARGVAAFGLVPQAA